MFEEPPDLPTEVGGLTQVLAVVLRVRPKPSKPGNSIRSTSASLLPLDKWKLDEIRKKLATFRKFFKGRGERRRDESRRFDPLSNNVLVHRRNPLRQEVVLDFWQGTFDLEIWNSGRRHAQDWL